MSVLHEQPVLPLHDAERYGVVKAAVDTSFGEGKIQEFLQSLDRRKLPIREFESALNAGLMGQATTDAYNRMGECDQAQIRELYLDLVEQVAPELRRRFFQLYSYY